MKAAEIRDLSENEITKKIDETEEAYFNLRFQSKVGGVDNPLQMRKLRREIARCKTILCEKKKVSGKEQKTATDKA